MRKYVKFVSIMVLMLLATITVVAQQNTPTNAEIECSGLEQPPVDFQADMPSGHAEILARVHVVGSNTNRFRGLGGETELRDYDGEMPVKYDANGNVVEDESFVGLVIDPETGAVLNDPDYGGGKGFFFPGPLKFIAPEGVFFIIVQKAHKIENLPDTAYVVVPGDEVCFGPNGAHGWAYSGGYPYQVVEEKGDWFGPFTDEELRQEMRRVYWRIEVLNSDLTLSVNPSDYVAPVDNDEDAGG